LTRQVLGDGWLRTGDLGCIDVDGEVQLVGARERFARERA
jgi:long-subunit acyl-CoA synthetase (AMP-forming)